MSRVRTFIVRVPATAGLVRDQPKTAKRFARELIVERAAEDFRGPRGGRYVPINQPHDFYDSDSSIEDMQYGHHSFYARVEARYVRPRSALETK